MKNIYGKILKIVKRASKIYFGKNFYEREDKHKFENDDVTNRDILTQQYLQNNLLKILPNSKFIGEEGKVEKDDNVYTWIVDPIDGTFNFKHDVPIYGTQICLHKEGKPIFSCLYLPVLDKLYYAIEGQGAFLNGKKIGVSSERDLKDIGVCIGDFQVNYDIEKEKKIMLALSDKVKRIRMFGCSCFDSCSISRGTLDVYISHTVTPWDILPGDFLIRQAGGSMFVNDDKTTYIYGNRANAMKVIEILKDIDTFTEKEMTIF